MNPFLLWLASVAWAGIACYYAFVRWGGIPKRRRQGLNIGPPLFMTLVTSATSLFCAYGAYVEFYRG